MIKQIYICQCDICGATAEAKAINGRYNEMNYTYPDDWRKGYKNPDVHICPECSRRLNRESNL